MTSDEKEQLKVAALRIIEDYIANPDAFQLDLSALDFRIKLNGDKWKGVVDRPVAQFLLDVDKRVQSELTRVGVPLPKSTHGVVALRIEEGSMDAFLENAKGMLDSFRKMKPYIQVLVLVTILSVVGITFADDIIEKLNEPNIEKIKADERVELVEKVAAIAQNQRDNEAPVRKLLGSMDKDDVILLPGSPPLKKDEAKQILTKGTRSKVYKYYVDFPYIVQELSTRKPGEWEIGLAFGETTFKAKMEITDEEISELLSKFQEAHSNGSEISPDLQVTAEINAKGIQRATVIGMGEPRPRSVSLGEAIRTEQERSIIDDDSSDDEEE